VRTARLNDTIILRSMEIEWRRRAFRAETSP